MTPTRREKLPVPAQWQSAVLEALADLAARLALPRHAVAVTRVQEERWRPGEGAEQTVPTSVPRQGLSIWLMAQGQTHKYRCDAETGVVAPEH